MTLDAIGIMLAIIGAALILADRGPPPGGGYMPRGSTRPLTPPPHRGTAAHVPAKPVR